MAQDILIVDDDPIALNQYGNEVRLNLNIDPFLSNDPQQALTILRDYPIKVLVTDQLMPIMNGTEMVRHVRDELKLAIPCIMLTAAPNNLDMDEMIRLQFFGFIKKQNMHSELVETINKAIQRYDLDEASKFIIGSGRILAEQKSWFKWQPHVTLKLVRISSVIKSFTHENDWNTEIVAQTGKDIKQTISIQKHVSSSFEYGIQADSMMKVGLKAGKLITEVENALEQKISFSSKVHYEQEIKIQATQEIEVKALSNQPNAAGLILQSREYQTAPVYIRVNCLLELVCSCCLVPRSFTASLDFPTERIALRYIEHFDKGPIQKIYSGFLQANILP